MSDFYGSIERSRQARYEDAATEPDDGDDEGDGDDGWTAEDERMERWEAQRNAGEL